MVTSFVVSDTSWNNPRLSCTVYFSVNYTWTDNKDVFLNWQWNAKWGAEFFTFAPEPQIVKLIIGESFLHKPQLFLSVRFISEKKKQTYAP